MSETSIKNRLFLEQLLDEGCPFAIYRRPGELHPRLLKAQENDISLYYHLRDLNGCRGFVMAPFAVSEQSPIVVIHASHLGEYFPLTDVCEQPLPFKEETFIRKCSADYASCFAQFMIALQHGDFEKLVLSRSQKLPRPNSFSVLRAFEVACRQYIHSYVYLCYTPQTGMWLGSTPEIILSGEKECWRTVALAGTQALQKGMLPQHWSEKNCKEQAYVASYIRSCLASLGITASETGPYPVYAGALAHLTTDFSFSMGGDSLGDVLHLLHPTPAVCGLPKERAYRFILQYEANARQYYSGFVGWMDSSGMTDLYVNLRCMKIAAHHLIFYAGGGLLASSELEDEWLETEKKCRQ